MISDADAKHAGPDERTAGVSMHRDQTSPPRGVPLTTMELCGRAMFLVAGGMALAVGEQWWVRLIIAAMVILILLIGMRHERWQTRERHRLIESALKRTGVLKDSGRSRQKASRRPRPRRGGKPIETGPSGGGQDAPARLGDGAVPPDPPPAPERKVVGEAGKAGEAGREEETPPEVTDPRNGP